MKNFRVLRLFFIFLLIPSIVFANPFPNKTIRIYVYTKAGGLVDVTARKIAKQLEQDYQTVIVENYPGGAGLKALNRLLKQPADGHRLLAITNSFISQVLNAGGKTELEKLHYLSLLAKDYECLITNKDSRLNSIQDLIQQSEQGRLVWAGPAAGGTDHLFAKKVWKSLGIEGKWLPFASGKRGMLAVVGGHADVYVGNPQDILGFDNLQILAVASKERLAGFEVVPTFQELDYDSLTGEVLWRGLAIHKETPQEIITTLENSLKKLSLDSDWQRFLTERNVESNFIIAKDFQKEVDRQISSELGLQSKELNTGQLHLFYLLGLFICLILLFVRYPVSLDYSAKDLIIPLIALLYIACTYYCGYLLATVVTFLLLSYLAKLSLQKMFLSTCAWLIFSYLVFYYLLGIPLPSGVLWI